MVAYDVPAERTRIFHKILSKYLMRMQFSLFCGDLRQSDYLRLLKELRASCEDRDKLMILRTQNRRNVEIDLYIENQIQSYDDHIAGTVL
jgi:CRISPR-associated protein Cas2